MDLIQNKYNIVLGSQSPRRQELLKGLDVQFTTRVPDIDESYSPKMDKRQVPSYLAEQKMKALLENCDASELIICSDTIVLLRGEILEKPLDKAHAEEMLNKLSGQTHEVITGVSMATTEKQITFDDTTQVTFKTLDKSEIDYYLDHYKPYDKAGSYGVQEWIGMMGITEMKGSYFTVMGFPVHLVYKALKTW